MGIKGFQTDYIILSQKLSFLEEKKILNFSTLKKSFFYSKINTIERNWKKNLRISRLFEN